MNGKSEERLYVAYLEGASLALYAQTSLEEGCCTGKPLATTQSRKHGSFSLEGVQQGAYWLRLQKNQLIRLIPIRVTKNFDEKLCRDPSVGRSVVVDSSPPKIESRIR